MNSPARLALGVITFLVILGYCLIWIFQGLDITHAGYYLTRQLLLNENAPHYVYGTTWLSDQVGGLWLQLVGDKGLIGARLGWACLYALTGSVAFAILSVRYAPWYCALATTVAAIAMNYGAVMVIRDISVAVFILLSACACLLVSQVEQQSPTVRRFAAMTAGALLGLGVMSRLPLAFGLVMPGIPLLARRWCGRDYGTSHLRAAGIAWISAAIAVVLCLVWLRSLGRLEEYLQLFVLGYSPEFEFQHSASELIRACGQDAILAIQHSINLVAVSTLIGVVLVRLFARIRWPRAGPLIFFAGLMVVVAIVYFVRGPNHVLLAYRILLPGLAVVIGLFCLVVHLNCVPRDERSVDQVCLITLALCIPLVVMVGTPSGFIDMHHAIWLLLPAGLLYLPKSLSELSQSFTGNQTDSAKSGPYLIGFTLFVFVLFPMAYRFINATVDHPNRRHLMARIEHPRLRHIRTWTGRANSMNELIGQLDLRLERGDELLAYNSVPMIHYITETVPALGWCWPTQFDVEMLRSRLAEFGTSRPMPSLVVRAVTNPRHRRWGGISVWSNIFPLPTVKLEMIDKVLEENGYQEVWSNADFMILARRVPPTT